VTLYVPLHPDALTKAIVTAKFLVVQVAADAEKLMREQTAHREELEGFLARVDAVNFLANFGLGLAKLSIAGRALPEGAKLLKAFLAEETVRRAEMILSLGEMAIPAPSEPKTNFKFFLRHTVGPWSPSYWASVWAAVSEGDIDLYLHGSAAQESKNKAEIRRKALEALKPLKTKIADLEKQRAQTFYSHRV
jgi:hypothetical protein